MEILYTFQNTHIVISAEQALLQAGLPVKVMPVPGAITAGCGMCLRLPQECSGQAETVMAAQNLTAAAYKMQDGVYQLLE